MGWTNARRNHFELSIFIVIFQGPYSLLLGWHVYSSVHRRCELIFIDGGHSYDVAIRDLKNFAALANLKNNVLLLDDTFLDDVRRAWDEMLDMGYVEESFP